MKNFLILLLVAISTSCGKVDIDTSTNPPETIFKHTIGEELLGHAEEIQGGGYCWQGYVVHIRFKTNIQVEQVLRDSGYTEVEWSIFESYFKLPEEFLSRFTPPWNPNSLVNKKCYSKSNVTNSWTHGGTHYYLFDQDSGIVYFYGIGA
jgi:hypothetical protein